LGAFLSRRAWISLHVELVVGLRLSSIPRWISLALGGFVLRELI
jgi:hypothetical protein